MLRLAIVLVLACALAVSASAVAASEVDVQAMWTRVRAARKMRRLQRRASPSNLIITFRDVPITAFNICPGVTLQNEGETSTPIVSYKVCWRFSAPNADRAKISPDEFDYLTCPSSLSAYMPAEVRRHIRGGSGLHVRRAHSVIALTPQLHRRGRVDQREGQWLLHN